MEVEQILELRNQAIDNVSKKRVINGQVERTWMQDDFDIEFARLILQSVETKQEKQLRMYKE